MKTEHIDDLTIQYDDSPEAKERIYSLCLAFFKEHEVFRGESIQQSDGPIIDAPNFLSKLAEEGFKFETTWREE
jgi:hypothetical protein